MVWEAGCQCIMQNSYDNQVVYAGFFARMTAYILDMIIVGAVHLFVRAPLMGISSYLDFNILFSYTILDIILYAVSILYFVFFTYTEGSTPGKKVMNLKVVNADGGKLTLFQVLYRETIGRFLSGAILGLGYLMIVFDKRKRSIHDMLSDTRVIYSRIN